jgi:hypothetical protein
MPTEFITTDGSSNPIKLSLKEVYGHTCTTVIMVNHAIVATLNDTVKDYILGTNQGLSGNTVTVTTTSLKTSPSVNTEIDYSLDSGTPPTTTDTDAQTFSAGVNAVPHFMTYFMV